VMEWLSEQDVDGMIALVGHEPDLSRLVGWFLVGAAVGIVEFKKGAAALIDFDGAAAKSKGRLALLLPPDIGV
jgi:phosphohistidine phosphatase